MVRLSMQNTRSLGEHALMMICGMARAEYREQWISTAPLQRETHAPPRAEPRDTRHATRTGKRLQCPSIALPP
ncbi:hypothetical protein BDI4_580024 [Burkholderia diffusa]|nr:hypothetical protein BDI4_580024 [Burkholderia diffusa]